jgi:hypothetical protein
LKRFLGPNNDDLSFEFTHLHIQIREDDFVLKVLGKRPVAVKNEEEILKTLKLWAKEVRKANWSRKRR